MNTLHKRLVRSLPWRLLAVSAVALSSQWLHAEASTRRTADRAGMREFYATYTYFTAPTLVVQDVNIPGYGTHDSVMTFDDSDLWGIGFGFGINERLNVNGEFNFGSVDYEGTWGTDTLRGEGDLFTSRINLDWNILQTPLTPFVTAGIGYTYYDSNVPSEIPDVVCWWDPWWGYICDGYVETHHTSEFTWNAGAGLRWDPTDGFFIKALYDVTWMEVGASGTEAFPQYQLIVGWKW